MTSDRLAAIEAVPANEAVLAILRPRGVTRNARVPWTLDGYELHTHPDLEERLGQLAEGLPGGGVVGLYGAPALVAGDVVYAIAGGMSTIHVRIPAGPVADEIRASGDRGESEFGAGWVVADAWLSHLPSTDGTRVLRGWLTAAATAATDLQPERHDA